MERILSGEIVRSRPHEFRLLRPMPAVWKFIREKIRGMKENADVVGGEERVLPNLWESVI
jgi:hypothetical protein